MPRAFMNYHGESACPFHRLLLPGRFCVDAVERAGWTIDIGEGMPPGYDCYFFHGLPNDVAMIEFTKLKRQKAKLVWSLDDDWLTIPEWNPAKPPEIAMGFYETTKQLADWILTSTPHLASTFYDVSHKVLCAPNMLDITQFPIMAYTERDGRRDYEFRVDFPVKVFWAGGPTHKEDIALLERPIHRILEKYPPDKVVMVFQGMSPPSSLLLKYLHRGVLHYQTVPFQKYQQTVNHIAPNVCLAPLAPVDFNLSKSNLRVMEAWALNAVPVASDFGEYSCVREGYDGRLARAEDQWFNAIDRLVSDHEYRLNMAVQGRNRAEFKYNWNVERCRAPWYAAYSKIFGVDVRAADAAPAEKTVPELATA